MHTIDLFLEKPRKVATVKMENWKSIYGEGGLPTLQDIWALPRWAMVAYGTHAARLAYRHLPRVFAEATEQQRASMLSALRSGEMVNPRNAPLRSIEEVTDIAKCINDVIATDSNRAAKARHLVDAVLRVPYASQAAAMGNDTAVSQNACDGAQAAVWLDPKLRDRLHRDFADLSRAAKNAEWNEDSLAPLTFFYAGGTRLFGRLMPLRAIAEYSNWPISGDQTCLFELEEASDPGDIIFVSHGWLTPDHPDPHGEKWAKVVGWWTDLQSLRKEIAALDPANIDRNLQRALTKRRAANPLMLRRDRLDVPMQLGGWRWSADGGEIDGAIPATKGNQAALNFHRWLLDTIESVEGATLWIDSFAWPTPGHRRDCEYCQSGMRTLLPLLPRIVKRSACVRIDHPNIQNQRRGWLMLEQACSALHNTPSAFGVDNAPINIEHRLDRLDFNCTTQSDGSAIVVGYALARADAVLNHIHSQYAAVSLRRDHEPLLNLLWMPLAQSVDLTKTKEPLLWRLETLVDVMRGKRFQSACGVLGCGLVTEVGKVALLLGSYVAAGILLSTAWERNSGPMSRLDSLIVAQSCLYTYLCKIDVGADGVACWIADAWSELLNLDWPERGMGKHYPERRSKTLEVIQNLTNHWQAGGTIDVTLKDIGQQVLVSRELVRTLDANVWNDPEPYLRQYYNFLRQEDTTSGSNEI